MTGSRTGGMVHRLRSRSCCKSAPPMLALLEHTGTERVDDKKPDAMAIQKPFGEPELERLYNGH